MDGPDFFYRFKLIKGLMVFLGGLFHIAFYLSADYALYWLLDMIRIHADVKVQQDGKNIILNKFENTYIYIVE